MKMNTKFWAWALELFLKLMIVWVIVGPIVQWFFPGMFYSEQIYLTMKDMYGFDIKSFSLLQRAGLYLMSAVGTVFVLYALVIGIGITRLWGKGELLTEATVELFARLRKVWIYAMLYFFLQTTFSCFVLMPKMTGGLIAITLGASLLGFLMIYAFFAAIAALVRRGAKLQKDQDLTV